MQKLPLRLRPFRTVPTPLTPRFPFPVHAKIRLAQLCESSPTFGLLKPFRPESSIHLQGFRPNIIAGTAFELQRLAEEVDLGTVRLSSVDHGVIVLTFCGQAPLLDVTRVVLWQAFGVPIYEVFAGLDNAVLGYECELHEGWHLSPQVHLSEADGELTLNTAGVMGLSTALHGVLTEEKCPCGRPGWRILNLKAVPRPERRQHWAATA